MSKMKSGRIRFNMRKSSDLVVQVFSSEKDTALAQRSTAAAAQTQTDESIQSRTFSRSSDKARNSGFEGETILLMELDVHSEILTEQSEYFERQLSERWEKNGESEGAMTTLRSRNCVRLSCLHNVEHSTYEICFKLMYQAHYERPETVLQARFRDVNEALQVLQVCVFFLFSSGVNAALFFLQAVPWTADEKDSVSYLLVALDTSSLSGPILEDLWARVNGLDDYPACNSPHIRTLVVEEWEKIFVDWKQRLLNTSFVQRSYAPPTGSWLPSPDETRALCNRSIWLFERAIDLRVGHKVIQFMQSDRIEFSPFLITNLFQRWPGPSQGLQLRASSVVVSFYIVLLRLLEALERGEVICDCDTRCGFVCKWFPIIAYTFDKRVSSPSEDRNHFGKPVTSQVQIYINSRRLFPQSKPRHLDNLVNCDVDPKQAITESLEAVIKSLRPLDQQKILSLWIQSDILLSDRSSPILDLEGSFKDFCDTMNQCHSAPLTS